MYEDTHTAWIGYQPQKNQYAFYVDRYTPGSRWFLSANAFISNCGNTSGSVYMRPEGGGNIKVGTWTQQLLPCYPGGDMPGNPDSMGLTLDYAHIFLFPPSVKGDFRYVAEKSPLPPFRKGGEKYIPFQRDLV